VIAKNLVFLGDQGANASAESWIAGLSLFIAALALASSIWSARSQIKHNRLSAKPHLAASTGTISYVLTLTNHGPGVAGIESYTATLAGNSYDLLVPAQVERLNNDLCEGFIDRPDFEYEVLSKGEYLSPGVTSRTIVPGERLVQQDRDLLIQRLFRMRVEVKATCVYGLLHTSTSVELEADPG